MIKLQDDETSMLAKVADHFLANLEAFAQDHWLASYGELQLDYNELPLRILIAEDASICEAHQQLLGVYEPFRSGLSFLQLNINFYRKQADSKYCQLFAFQNTKDFLNGKIDGQALTEETYDRVERHNSNIFKKLV